MELGIVITIGLKVLVRGTGMGVFTARLNISINFVGLPSRLGPETDKY